MHTSVKKWHKLLSKLRSMSHTLPGSCNNFSSMRCLVPKCYSCVTSGVSSPQAFAQALLVVWFHLAMIVTDDNSHDTISNSDLELAGGLLHMDDLTQTFNIIECTVY
ncbi:hypothetical protein ACHAW6_010046 [Cyclotella cf. meneghiniana]